jgi:GT2 family glycosyltransferase
MIVCTRKEGGAASVHASVLRNCVPAKESVELVEVVGARGMVAGYREGLERARGSIIMFVHDDVEIWAGHGLYQKVLELAGDLETGVVGVAGTRKLESHACWWMSESARDPTTSGSAFHATAEHGIYASAFGPFGRVAVIDGVCMVCDAETARSVKWQSYAAWHFYDIGFSLALAQQGLRNYTVPFPLMHKSIGKPGPDWEAGRRNFAETHVRDLPYGVPVEKVKFV